MRKLTISNQTKSKKIITMGYSDVREPRIKLSILPLQCFEQEVGDMDFLTIQDYIEPKQNNVSKKDCPHDDVGGATICNKCGEII